MITLDEYNVVDSKGVTVVGSDINLKVYNLGISTSFSFTTPPPLLPGLANQEWSYSNTSHELNVYSHPYAFTDLGEVASQISQSLYHSAQAEINKAACIEYYTP